MVKFLVLKNLLGKPMTYVTDPIGDFLTRMRNAQAIGKKTVSAPNSRLKMQLCDVLKKHGWITGAAVIGDAPKQSIQVTFNAEHPKLELKRVSKPGRRTYSAAKELKSVLSGYGSSIISTSQGLMTDEEARKANLGGEILCTIA